MIRLYELVSVFWPLAILCFGFILFPLSSMYIVYNGSCLHPSAKLWMEFLLFTSNEQWILEEFNFEHLLFFRWHLSCLPSSFNRHTRLDSSGGPASASIRLRTSPTTLSQEPIFQDSAGPSKNGDTSPKNQGIFSTSTATAWRNCSHTTTNQNFLQIDIWWC